MLSCLPIALLADGKVFVSTRASMTRVDIPDQQAIICFSNGLERLVIQTSFRGSGTNFAWVVPLPAAPKIEAVPVGVFETLDFVFQPHLVLSVYPYWLWVVGTMLLIWLLSRTNRPALWFFVIVVLGGGLLLPALAPGRAKARGDTTADRAAVELLSREQVGIFDIATVRAQDPRALLDWMNTHGFTLPAAAQPAVAAYVREGWLFAAVQVHRRIDASNAHRIHPLSFTFPTRKAIYPLRLTGVENGPCLIDLYVFGPGRAVVEGFHVRSCDRPTPADPASSPRFTRTEGLVLADHVLPWTGDAPVATHLTGRLLPEQMIRDATFRWAGFLRTQPVLYVEAAATQAALNTTVSLLFPLLLWGILRRHRELPLPHLVRSLGLAACAVGVVVFVTLPRVPAGQLRSFKVRGLTISHMQQVSLQLAMLIEDDWLEARKRGQAPPATIAAIEKHIRDLLDAPKTNVWHPLHGQPSINLVTGGPIRIEPSPGNLSVRTGTNGFELVWHDAYGRPALVTSILSP